MTGAVGIVADEPAVAAVAPAPVVRAARRGAVGPDTVLDRPDAVRAGDVFPLLFMSPPTPADLPARLDWSDTAPHPWRRYAARIVDTGLVGNQLLMLIVGTFALFRPDEGGAALRFLDTQLGTVVSMIVETVMMIPVSALAVAWCGSTPGKAMFGIRLRQDGGRPVFRTMLRRELSVAGRGEAFGVPLLGFAANANAYRQLKREGLTPWDAANGLSVHHRPTTWGMSAWLVVLLFLTLLGWIALIPR